VNFVGISNEVALAKGRKAEAPAAAT